jgi:hypothetical protein
MGLSYKEDLGKILEKSWINFGNAGKILEPGLLEKSGPKMGGFCYTRYEPFLQQAIVIAIIRKN